MKQGVCQIWVPPIFTKKSTFHKKKVFSFFSKKWTKKLKKEKHHQIRDIWPDWAGTHVLTSDLPIMSHAPKLAQGAAKFFFVSWKNQLSKKKKKKKILKKKKNLKKKQKKKKKKINFAQKSLFFWKTRKHHQIRSNSSK